MERRRREGEEGAWGVKGCSFLALNVIVFCSVHAVNVCTYQSKQHREQCCKTETDACFLSKHHSSEHRGSCQTACLQDRRLLLLWRHHSVDFPAVVTLPSIQRLVVNMMLNYQSVDMPVVISYHNAVQSSPLLLHKGAGSFSSMGCCRLLCDHHCTCGTRTIVVYRTHSSS